MDTSDARLAALRDLVQHRVSTATASSALRAFPWDAEELLDLRVDHVVAMLQRFEGGGIDADELTAWADAVEARDDLGRQPGCEDTINDALFTLSNPELLDRDLVDVARELRAELAAGMP